MIQRFLFACVLVAVTAAFSVAADWPQWRGPNRDGYSADKGLLAKWPAGGPKLLYSLTKPEDVGAGYGETAVVGDKMYVIGSDSAKLPTKEFLTCLNVKDGTRVWQKMLNTTAGKFMDGWGGGPRSTPTVNDGYVYVIGGTGDLVCFSADKGDEKWRKNLKNDLKGGIPNWGYAESPLIDGDNLICTPGGTGGIVALNKATGETVWQCKDESGGAGYSSIVIAEIGGVKQYVQQNMKNGFGIRSKDGKLLWSTPATGTTGAMGRKTAVIPTPVIQGDLVFFTAGYGAGCECFKLEKDGDGTKATKLYSNKVITNHHGGVIGFEKYVFGHSDAGNKWICLDTKSGDMVWEDAGVGKGSVSYADGYFFCYSERSGALARVKATDKAYEEAGKFTIPSKSKMRVGTQGAIWAHPVIADGKLILRDYELMFVYDLLGPSS